MNVFKINICCLHQNSIVVIIFVLGVLGTCWLTDQTAQANDPSTDQRPNIVLIMVDDRTELNDVSTSNPQQFQTMVEIWDRMSAEIGEKKRDKPKPRKNKSKKTKSETAPAKSS